MTSSADLIVEHVASYLKKSPVDIKLANLYKIGEANIKGETMMFVDFHAIYQSKKVNKIRVSKFANLSELHLIFLPNFTPCG